MKKRFSEYLRFAGKWKETHNDFDPLAVKAAWQEYANANPLFKGMGKDGRYEFNTPPTFEEYFRSNKKKFYPSKKD